MKVANITFWVKDNQVSQNFYQKLGFKVQASTDRNSVVTSGDFSIYLIVAEAAAEEFKTDALATAKGKGMYLNISVEDVDQKYQELVAKDIVPIAEPRDWPWGNREFVVKDPDGFKICFQQAISKAANQKD